MTSNSHSSANLQSENESARLMHHKMTSREVDDFYYLVVKSISLEYAKVNIESTIGPGGLIAVAWIESYAVIYV